MTRKQFLATLGVGVLSILGIKNFVDLMQGKLLVPDQKQQEAEAPAAGFGTRKFGK